MRENVHTNVGFIMKKMAQLAPQPSGPQQQQQVASPHVIICRRHPSCVQPSSAAQTAQRETVNYKVNQLVAQAMSKSKLAAANSLWLPWF